MKRRKRGEGASNKVKKERGSLLYRGNSLCKGLDIRESTTGSERWVQLEGSLQMGSARRGSQVLKKSKAGGVWDK